MSNKLVYMTALDYKGVLLQTHRVGCRNDCMCTSDANRHKNAASSTCVHMVKGLTLEVRLLT